MKQSKDLVPTRYHEQEASSAQPHYERIEPRRSQGNYPFNPHSFLALAPVITMWGGFIVLVLLIGGITFFVVDRKDFLVYMPAVFTNGINLLYAGVIVLLIILAIRFIIGGLITHVMSNFVQNVMEPLRKDRVVYANEHFAYHRGDLKIHDHSEEKNVYTHKITEVAQPAKQIEAPNVALPLALPPAFDDLTMFKHWDLQPDNIYLGTGKGSSHKACTLDGLMHVAHDASTGGGKTTQTRTEIAMLLKIDATVVLCNPHFAPVDKKGNDWRPIASFLEKQGRLILSPRASMDRLLRKIEHIRDFLKWAATVEIDRRFDMQAQNNYAWKPLFIALDELPWLVYNFPEVAGYVIAIVQRGRAVDVLLITSAQSFLVDNTKLKGGTRDNFNTVYFMGGNLDSGAKMLDMGKKELNDFLTTEHTLLGKGVVMLRNNEAVPFAEIIRVPRGTNEGQYYMLGRADNYVLPEFRDRGTFQGQRGTVSGTLVTEERSRDSEGQDGEPDEDDLRNVPQTGTVEGADPEKIFSEEQRKKLLEGARQNTPIRDLPAFAGIGKDKLRYDAMRVFLRRNGFVGRKV